MSAENGKIRQLSAMVEKTAATVNPNGMPPKLASLKPARDLTLGGRGGAKKVFTPNLNVTRNKNANVKTSKDTTTRGRGGRVRSDRGSSRGGVGSGRGGRGGSAQGTLIQTTGVFSEGAGEVNFRKSSSFTRTEDTHVSSMRKPTINRNEVKAIDLKAEALILSEMFGDSEDEQDLVDDKSHAELIPVKLDEVKWKSVKMEHKEDANVDIPIDANKSVPAGTQYGSNVRYPKNIQDMFQATSKPQLFLIQLPDILPCEEENEETSTSSMSTSRTTISDSTTPASKSNSKLCRSLRSMDEGVVGKLIHYKSGKVKLILGNSHFNVDMGMETGFLQDLMSISTNREERSGNMINLGPIQAKLTATPDWEHLFKHQLNIMEDEIK